MKIQFTSKEISEYAVGNTHFKNDGGPIEVSSALGQELLQAKHFLGTGFVNVFEPVTVKGNGDEAAETEPAAEPARKGRGRRG